MEYKDNDGKILTIGIIDTGALKYYAIIKVLRNIINGRITEYINGILYDTLHEAEKALEEYAETNKYKPCIKTQELSE